MAQTVIRSIHTRSGNIGLEWEAAEFLNRFILSLDMIEPRFREMMMYEWHILKPSDKFDINEYLGLYEDTKTRSLH